MSFEQENNPQYEGRGQSDWGGCGVVIFRKESRGRKQSNQTTMPASLENEEEVDVK